MPIYIKFYAMQLHCSGPIRKCLLLKTWYHIDVNIVKPE